MADLAAHHRDALREGAFMWLYYLFLGLLTLGTALGVVGDSNVALVAPLGIGVVLSGVFGHWLWEVLEFSGADRAWGIAFYGLWLATVLVVMRCGIARRFMAFMLRLTTGLGWLLSRPVNVAYADNDILLSQPPLQGG